MSTGSAAGSLRDPGDRPGLLEPGWGLLETGLPVSPAAQGDSVSWRCLAQVSGAWFSSRFVVLPVLQTVQVLFPPGFSLLCPHCIFWAASDSSLKRSVLVQPCSVSSCCPGLPSLCPV